MTDTTQLGRLGLVHRACRLLVLLAVLLLAAGGLGTPRVAAADTICVALVVDFSPLGGDVDSGCTKVPSGANGYDVLRAGGHSFQICSNGVLGTIDGKPANGCQIKDDNHFWGYWHRRPGSTTWTFSNYGAAGYHPVEGSTEGWVWENGTTSPPADVPYPSGCHSPPHSPTPTPRATSAAASTPSPTAPRGGNAGTTGAGVTEGATASRTPARAKVGASSPPPHASASASVSPSRTTPTATQPAHASRTAASGSSNTAPALAGVGIAVLLGGGAWWRFRRPGPS